MQRVAIRVVFTRNISTYNVERAGKAAGLPLQPHKTTTEDGYILTMHRIMVENEGRDSLSKRPPILLQHGLWSSSDDWIVPGPNKSLSFLLARAGFDVWLGNTRGNHYSRDHTRLSPRDNPREYWDFSWHEMGLFDLPAMIDHVLKASGREQLYYLGHSQGTTAFFVMGSEKPQYNEKIKAMIALAPVLYLRHMKNRFLLNLAIFSDPMLKILNSTEYYKLLPQDTIIDLVNNWWTSFPDSTQRLADVVLKELSYYATEEVKRNLKDIIVSHMATGTSFKLLAHYAQCTQMDKQFRYFDYGPEKNLEIYGDSEAPLYKLQNLSAPLVAFYSDHDWLTHYKDVEMLDDVIKGIKLENINVPNFNHLDFIWADLEELNVFKKILNYLRA